MNALNPMAVLAAVLGDDALDVADVFSTDLYTGNDTSQSITNGLDMSGEGGLNWTKRRDNSNSHWLTDTVRGNTKQLITNGTNSEFTDSTRITSFNSDGHSVGSEGNFNQSSATFASWSFRIAPDFHDVVAWTGDGVDGRSISHNLGQSPGLIVVKRTDSTGNWRTWHRSELNKYGNLDDTGAFTSDAASSGVFNNYAGNDATFTAGININTNTATYVAYLFAHDTSDDGIIQCGSYTGNGSASGPTVTLGWEPQFLLRKRVDSTGSWPIADNARDASNPNTAALNANSSDGEFSAYDVDFTSTGFQLKTTNATVNANTGTYIYMAIRAEGA